MNIAFFLRPKLEVVYLKSNDNLQKGFEVLEKYKYTSIPIIDSKGKYVDSISEGDLLWYLKDIINKNQDIDISEKLKFINMSDIPRARKSLSVRINANMESLISMSVRQNFVPVVDDDNVFIGIITRSSIIDYCFNNMKNDKEII